MSAVLKLLTWGIWIEIILNWDIQFQLQNKWDSVSVDNSKFSQEKQPNKGREAKAVEFSFLLFLMSI